MGVPAFFRWLSRKYPSIVVNADIGFSTNYSFDNFYLDMNGIIHPCTHPENKPSYDTEEEMFQAIFEYVDMLMDMVRPKKLLYMAIDGVAPRAKMNQQRSRRFRASKETIEKKINIQQIKDELRLKGVVFDKEVEKSFFDSNVITPGTPFMMNLTKVLKEWIDKKLSQCEDVYYDTEGNPKNAYVWPKDLIVILSDSSHPGEGEHKIIDFIRKQRSKPNYNPNTKHCLFGSDADLIILGLATHELDFTVLREEFIPNQPKACEICNQFGHLSSDCQGIANIPDINLLKYNLTSFIYIRLCVLREYLERECEDLDFERYLDDFIFLCFFVGNDFLPHLPSLEIREGAIDKLLNIYKFIMGQYSHPKPYLTENGFVKLNKVKVVLEDFSKLEDDIFIKRKINDEKYKQKLKNQKELDYKVLNSEWMNPKSIVQRGENPEKMVNIKEEATNLRNETIFLKKRKLNDDIDEFDNQNNDEIQLWNQGWKERYYFYKFSCKNHEKISILIAKEYLIGLCWVMQYYYQGCVDWKWYYPFHYAPFASDFKNVNNSDIKFNIESKPFKPLEQLMSVFPAASCQSLPLTWQKLMIDKDSTIIDFYPTNFKIDLNGKKVSWQGVCILPFIDEDRLFKALNKVYPNLTTSEVKRNTSGPHFIFISKNKENSFKVLNDFLINNKQDIDICDSEVLNGIDCKLKKSNDFLNTFCFEFYDPIYEKNYIFPAKRLPKAILPKKILKFENFDFYKNRNSFNNFKPVIGFDRKNNEAFLDSSAHHALNFYNKSNINNHSNINNQLSLNKKIRKNVNFYNYQIQSNLNSNNHNNSYNQGNRNNFNKQNRFNTNSHQSTGSNRNNYQTPNYQTTNYPTTNYQTPNYQTPNYQTPNYQTPNYQTPNYQTPNYQIFNYQKPNYQKPNYQTPNYQTSNYQTPNYQTPDYQIPNYQIPNFQIPNYRTLNYQTSNNQVNSSHITSTYQDPNYKNFNYRNSINFPYSNQKNQNPN